MAAAQAAPSRRRWSALTQLPVLVVIALIVAFLIKTFLVQAFFVDGASMNPGLVHGDRVLVEKLSYRFHDPRPGDVVVFEKDVFGPAPAEPWPTDALNLLKELLGLPTGGEEDYIKRVVAGPGDAIAYSGSPRRLLLNGEEQDRSFLEGLDGSSPTVTKADCERLEMEVADEGCLVPAGKIFVMGDNRGNSDDSRALGPVGSDKVIGRGFLVIWPPADLGPL